MLTRKKFEQLQKTTGFNLDLLEKAYHLTRTLNIIQEHSILKENLILKGGTALNFIFFPISRISIDLDFDYTGAISKEKMVKQRPDIEKEIKEISSQLDYTLRDRGSSYIISRQSLQYKTIRNTKDHIKIEINYLDRIPLGAKEHKKFPSIFPDIKPFLITTYSLEELTAQKSIACINRSEPRDLYDLYILSKHKMSLEKIRTFAAIYLCMTADNNRVDISKINNFDIAKIKQELQQFIRSYEKLDPNNIRDEASIFLEKIVTFNKNQQRFIEAFYEEKKIIPDLIDIDETKLMQHPALLHKISE